MKWPYVYPRKDGRWDVDTGTKVTPRRRKICETENEVALVRADWQAELKKGGSQHTLSAEQRHDALQALSLMEKQRVWDSLSTAVQYYLKHRYPHGGDLTVNELSEHFIAAKRTAQRTDPATGERAPRYSAPYLTSLHKLTQLGDAMKETRLSNLRPGDIENYLDKLNLNDVSRYHYFQYFKMLFNYGVKHEFMERNPMAKLQSPLLERRDPRILTVEQANALTREAFNGHDGIVFPYTVLGLFGGIRPHEITKIKWGDFRDWHRKVRITASVAKTRDVRVVELPANAVQMLHDFRRLRFGSDEPDPAEPVVPLTHNLLRKRFRQAFRAAGIHEWPHDAARHTFASFYFQATKSMPRLMAQLGHSTPATSLRHYVNLTDESWISYFMIAVTDSQRETMDSYWKRLHEFDESKQALPFRLREDLLLKVLLDNDLTVLPDPTSPDEDHTFDSTNPPRPNSDDDLKDVELPFGDKIRRPQP